MIHADELKDLSIFGCLTDAQRERLAHMAADIRVQAGEWIIREGDPASFFALLEGSVEVMKTFGGIDRVVNKYERGDFFGEVPILLASPAIASLRAKEASRLVRLDKPQFKELIDMSRECSAVIMQTMMQRVTKIQEYIRDNSESRVLVVGSQYDTDCRDIRTFLSMNRIPYEWVDKDRDPDRVPSCMPEDLRAWAGGGGGPGILCGAADRLRKVAGKRWSIRTTPNEDGMTWRWWAAGRLGWRRRWYSASEGLCVLLIEKAAASGQAGTSSRIENYLWVSGWHFRGTN